MTLNLHRDEDYQPHDDLPHVIDQVFVFVSKDADGNEGVALSWHHTPLVCADATRLAELWPQARRMSELNKRTVALYRLSARELLYADVRIAPEDVVHDLEKRDLTRATIEAVDADAYEYVLHAYPRFEDHRLPKKPVDDG